MAIQVGGIKSVSSAVAIPENLMTNMRVQYIGTSQDDGRMIYNVSSGAPAFVTRFFWERMLRSMVPDAVFHGDTGRRFSSMHDLDTITRMTIHVPIVYADILVSSRDSENGIELSFDTTAGIMYPYIADVDIQDKVFKTREDADAFLQSSLSEKHFFWYIEAICSNVQDLYLLPEIDTTRTYTTSPLDCMDKLGYIAMRNMIYREFRDNISIDPLHVKLIVNNMTLYKRPVTLTRQTIVNDKSEWMTSSTFENIRNYMTASAFVGEVDHMKSIASHVLTGSQIPIGRGGDEILKLSPYRLAKKRAIKA